MLTFDEATHSYAWCGSPVPGVTSLLAPLVDFSRVPPAVLARAANRGRAAHLATELDDAGTLDEASVAPAIAPYLAAWRRFRAESGFECELIEAQLYHPQLGYAGTVDRIGRLNGARVVLDIKTSAMVHPAVGPQTAAYERALRATEGAGDAPPLRRFGLQLCDDGTYALKACEDDAGDWGVFVACLNLYRWRQRHAA